MKRESTVLPEHTVMDVLNRFGPGHPWIVNVVRFVVEDGELFHLSDDFTKVGLAVRVRPTGLGPKGRK